MLKELIYVDQAGFVKVILFDIDENVFILIFFNQNILNFEVVFVELLRQSEESEVLSIIDTLF